MENSTITNCHITSDIKIKNNGGSELIGSQAGGTITYCSVGPGEMYSSYGTCGGLLGNGSNKAGVINNCSSALTIYTDGSIAGGLIGINSNSVSLCYATGDVIGNESTSSYVGGLFGRSYNGAVSESYATGQQPGISMSAD